MSELPVGVLRHEHRSVTRSKEGGSLAFAYSKDGWLANTVGHVLAIPNTHLPLLTFKDIFHNPKEELVKKLSDRWKDVPWKGDVLVRVNHASFVGDIQRLLAKDDEVKGRPIFSTTAKSIDQIARYLYIPWQLMNTLSVKMLRQNHYDAVTNTMTIFHPNDAFGMQELGRAKYFDSMKDRAAGYIFGAFPVVRTVQEYKASEHAMKQFSTDAQRKQGLKIMEPLFSYRLGLDVFGLLAPKQVGDFVGSLAGTIAGHVTSRVPGLRISNQYERFGYVFEGKEPKYEKKYFHGPQHAHEPAAKAGAGHTDSKQPELQDHQVYVSSARAMRPITGGYGRKIF